jgi:hypothetical protein
VEIETAQPEVNETAQVPSGPFAGVVRRLGRPSLLGGFAALAIGSLVYSQFNLYGNLARDSAIYLYGGQRFVHGVPPYASIMDPKGPMSGILCGFGVAVARLVGGNDILVTRGEFAGLSILAVLGIYLLVLELWHSVLAGVAAAATFASFKMFAWDAFHGPDGHTPGIVFFIFALWLTVRRQWYWAGCAASLAFFSWQPLVAYPLMVVVCAAAWSPGRRLAATAWSVAGVATPLVLLTGYYAAEGYVGKLFEGTFLFPVEGTYRPAISFGQRLHGIFHGISRAYGLSAILLAVGIVVLVAEAVVRLVRAGAERRAAALSPIVLLLIGSFVLQVAYVLYDYIGWTHAFPLLPYGAVGIGAGAARLLRWSGWRERARRASATGLVAAVIGLTAACAVGYYQPSDSTKLHSQQASSCALQRSLPPGTALWSIDNPLPLVLLHRVNPDNFAYVGSGLAEWKVKHTRGGFAGWMRQIEERASIVALQYWREHIPLRQEMRIWLRTHGYRFGYIGQWAVYATVAARAELAANSIELTRESHPWPVTTAGGRLFDTKCGAGG